MDIKTIQKLINLLKKSKIYSIEIKENKNLIKIKNNNQYHNSNIPNKHTINNIPLQTSIKNKKQNLSKTKNNNKLYTIYSPMVGTLYTAPAPNKPPFVKIGQLIKIGDTLCIIEAMKMFNEIETDHNGIIKDILINNNEPVEYKQPLFIIELT
ncbi:acetyl-CoA carboxylase, biotin carboxyl carrier protein [Candidatus Legionella polyplacis]|uniref:Biotin carboxyl carrier protein of acetyl-CoA carboxylase n=1 Tax=Candidatus Legionella polyplacis TaxID=2005262 RepID=A0ABZ2GYC8_9GAMM|nr:acetyl-CoA carboxylase biotin carboxyl carrier protein [Candidatus Legionella polyplacis]ATW01839.1 acetyl-CoA carboxylase, biotin carboxyl carrier protein [Candidatus Legionella polyplacis]